MQNNVDISDFSALKYRNKYKVLIPFSNLGELIDNKRVKPLRKKVLVEGYCVLNGDNINYLIRENKNIETYCYELDYYSLIDYQRLIDMSIVKEIGIEIKGIRYVLYELIVDEEVKDYIKTRKLFNHQLIGISKKKRKEWEASCDVEVLLPVECDNINQFNELNHKDQTVSDLYLKYIEKREISEREFEIKRSTGDDSSQYDKKSKTNKSLVVDRKHIGKTRIKVLVDYPCDNPNDPNNILGTPFFADLFITKDLNTTCAVLHIVILSLPNLISHFMDNMTSNALLADLGNDTWVDLTEFLKIRFNIDKRGTPKIFATFFRDRKFLKDNYVASMLLSEIIYNEKESLGQITDKDIVSIVSDNVGMGQFDRAKIYAYSNSLLQFSDENAKSTESRLEDEAVECYYMELLCLEEASIGIAQNNINKLLSDKKSKRQVFFLIQNIKIYHAFVNTMNYWNFEPVYPAARKSLDMIRKAFNIDDKEAKIKKNFEIVNQYYSTLENYNNFISTTIITLVARIITVIGIVDKINELHTANGWDVRNILIIAILSITFLIIPWIVKLIFNQTYSVKKFSLN